MTSTGLFSFSSQKLADFPVEAINMLDFLTMFIHYGELPIKVSLSRRAVQAPSLISFC